MEPTTHWLPRHRAAMRGAYLCQLQHICLCTEVAHAETAVENVQLFYDRLLQEAISAQKGFGFI